ncbi:MAG TPA: Fe-S cluster assembly protein HesB [Actinomycetota bacterium]|nr:Fe-S cluster assembly protein HesB [Actinomycetota bacterium]
MRATLDLALRGAGGEAVDLFRTINSHGFADLPPMRLDESQQILEATIPIPGARPRRVRIGAGRPGRASVDVRGPALSDRAAVRLLDGVRHVLRLDADLSSFYGKAAEDPDLAWAAAGAGRMLRSPTVFEDVVKTICTTNCSWALTTRMVTAMVSELGERPVGVRAEPLSHAFPSPAAMAEQPERFFREVVRAGYRAPHFVTLSKAVASGDLDLEGLGRAGRGELTDEDVERALLGLPGVGPYAAAHIMMTIGRDSRLILDSWSRPKYAKLVGKRAVNDGAIERRFRRYGEHAGLAFWLFVTRDWIAQD